MNTTKAAIFQSAAKTNWELAAFHRSIGQKSRSIYYATKAQACYAMQREAEAAEPVKPPTLRERLLGALH